MEFATLYKTSLVESVANLTRSRDLKSWGIQSRSGSAAQNFRNLDLGFIITRHAEIQWRW